MKHVMTIIVDPTAPSPEDISYSDLIDFADSYIEICAGKVRSVATLSKDEASDIFFSISQEGLDRLHAILIERNYTSRCDWFIQPDSEGRKKRLLIADMDSTMIQVECIDELADFAGIRDRVEAITEAAMRGELDFDQALTERVALLKGMDTDVLQQCFDERVKYTRGARSLVRTMAREGAITALVSGGFTFFTARVSEWLGFEINKANFLGEQDGQLSGEVVGEIVNAETKREMLEELATNNGIEHADIMAVGDGANDIPMIMAAGIGAAFHAKPKAAEAADFAINHGDLSALLFMQGYQRTDFEPDQ